MSTLTQSQVSRLAEAIISGNVAVDATLAEIRRRIRAGSDPLGEMLASARQPEARRDRGAVYTPARLVRSMFDIAAKQLRPARIVDPGAGSGRFIIEAARRFPAAELICIETDPLALEILRANLKVHRLDARVKIVREDFRSISLPPTKGETLFIGNPPYIRHHRIAQCWKRWFARSAAARGIQASKLAGSHVHFFFKVAELARAGDVGVFITSAEWLEVNYGASLRALFCNGLGGNELHLFDAADEVFENTLTTAVISSFRVGSNPRHVRINRTALGASGLRPRGTLSIEKGRLAGAQKWRHLLDEQHKPSADSIPLGAIFKVKRGQVTGCNQVWIESGATPALADRFKTPCITRAREIISGDLQVAGKRRVIQLPADLRHLADSEATQVRAFLQWAKELKAHESYIAQHRTPWWRVELYAPAPIICTYMARGLPTFVRNPNNLPLLNIGLNLYPRIPLTEQEMLRICDLLNSTVRHSAGRQYSGGLLKFEPKELERVPIPGSVLPCLK